VRDLPIRIAIVAGALLVASVGFVAVSVFLCIALYSFLSMNFAPPVAALLAAVGILILSLLAIFISGAVGRLLAASARRARAKRGGKASVISAEVGRLLGENAQNFINERPILSLMVALVGGFAVGASPRLRAFLQNVLKS
jgi:hypothetical protein